MHTYTYIAIYYSSSYYSYMYIYNGKIIVKVLPCGNDLTSSTFNK